MFDPFYSFEDLLRSLSRKATSKGMRLTLKLCSSPYLELWRILFQEAVSCIFANQPASKKPEPESCDSQH
jgi:hypothetical protein